MKKIAYCIGNGETRKGYDLQKLRDIRSKSVVQGKSVDLGGRRIIKKKKIEKKRNKKKKKIKHHQ